MRYAAALFELANERKLLDQTASDLARLKEILVQSPDLRRFLRSPVLTREQHKQALDVLLSKAGVADLTQNFIGLLAKNRRLFALGEIIGAFLDDLSRRRGEIRAEVTVAQGLTASQAATMDAVVKDALGKNATITVNVDPSLLGGMVVKVGSRLIDNSLRTKIDKLQLAMKAPGGLL